MCKMLIDLENEKEVDALLEQVTHVCKAMLGFPLKFPGTRFYRGLQVSIYLKYIHQFNTFK